MRVVFGAVALGLLTAGTVRAADEVDWVWAKAPGRADLIGAYPEDAAKADLAGSVKLRCLAAADGTLQRCAVVEDTPSGRGFGAAALSLTPTMRLDANAADGRSVGGREVLIPVEFNPAVLHGGPAVTAPQWLRQPSSNEMASYYPAGARGVKGHATIECVVTARGAMDQCAVTEETPADHGFGAAAVAMASLMIMRPMTRDGLPVGGAKVMIPIGFEATIVSTEQVSSFKVLTAPPWSLTPTGADMDAAFPRRAIGKVASARVVLRCDIERDGRIDDCDSLQETPVGLGFAQAARGLVKDFRVVTAGMGDKWGMPKVDVPFDFRDPSTPAAPGEIYDPRWRISPPSKP